MTTTSHRLQNHVFDQRHAHSRMNNKFDVKNPSTLCGSRRGREVWAVQWRRLYNDTCRTMTKTDTVRQRATKSHYIANNTKIYNNVTCNVAATHCITAAFIIRGYARTTLSSRNLKAAHHRAQPQYHDTTRITRTTASSHNRPSHTSSTISINPPQWSSSKKSWTRSSFASRRALTTRMSGTQTLVRPIHTSSQLDDPRKHAQTSLHLPLTRQL